MNIFTRTPSRCWKYLGWQCSPTMWGLPSLLSSIFTQTQSVIYQLILLTLHFMSFHPCCVSSENISLVLSRCGCALCESTGTLGRLKLLIITCSSVRIEVHMRDPDCWVDLLLWLLPQVILKSVPLLLRTHPQQPFVNYPPFQSLTLGLWSEHEFHLSRRKGAFPLATQDMQPGCVNFPEKQTALTSPFLLMLWPSLAHSGLRT